MNVGTTKQQTLKPLQVDFRIYFLIRACEPGMGIASLHPSYELMLAFSSSL